MEIYKFIFFHLILFFSLALGIRKPVKYPILCGSRIDMNYAEVFFDTDDVTLSLYAINEYCYKCSKTLVSHSQSSISVSCAHVYSPHKWKILLLSNKDDKILVEHTCSFEEMGRYTVSPRILSVDAYSFDITFTETPIHVYQPVNIALYIIFGIVFLSYTAPILLKYLIEICCRSKSKEKTYHEFYPSNENNVPNMNVEVGMKDTKDFTHHVVEHDYNHDMLTESNHLSIKPLIESSKVSTIAISERFQSLDTFRGLSLCLMIFGNYGGGGYWSFNHTDWNGFTIADLFFPWFMWMMGVSMALSHVALDKQAKIKGLSTTQYHRQLWYKAIKRSIIFFSLGSFYENGIHTKLDEWRIPGVLQYFGFSYFVTSATVIALKSYTTNAIHDISSQIPTITTPTTIMMSSTENHTNTIAAIKHWWKSLWILWGYRYEWIIQLTILLIYISVCLGAKVPGCPRGYNGPGGISENGKYMECTGGIHKYIDIILFSSKHIAGNPSCRFLYNCTAYDPEGAWGSLTACTLTYLGLMSGRILIHFKSHRERLQTWIFGSFLLLLLSGILCGFRRDEGLIPINKNLWSTSFGFMAAGSGLIGLSITYLLVDVFKVWTGAPMRYLGINSILFYSLHPLGYKYFPFRRASDMLSHARLIRVNVICTSCWLVIAYLLHYFKIFIKV